MRVYIKGKNRKKFRQGEEYGSARWGRPEDIRPYMDDDFSNNDPGIKKAADRASSVCRRQEFYLKVGVVVTKKIWDVRPDRKSVV